MYLFLMFRLSPSRVPTHRTIQQSNRDQPPLCSSPLEPGNSPLEDTRQQWTWCLQQLALPVLLILGVLSQAASWELPCLVSMSLLSGPSHPPPGPAQLFRGTGRSWGQRDSWGWVACSAVVAMLGSEHHLTSLSSRFLSHDHRGQCRARFHCLVFSVGLAPG